MKQSAGARSILVILALSVRSIFAVRGGSALLAVVLLANSVAGATAANVVLRVDGSCPTEEALTNALGPLLPGRALRIDSEAADAIVVEDLTSSYRVVVGARRRELQDPARDCSERARSAAVAIALALDPPHVAEAPTTVPTALPPAPARPPSALWMELVGSAVSAIAPEDGGVFSGGAMVRVRAGSARVAFSGGVGLLAPGTATAGSVRVSLLRFPVDAGLQLRATVGSASLAGELGLALIPFVATGENLTRTSSGGGLDLGARLAGVLDVTLRSALALTFTVELTGIPVPSTLEVQPRGIVGATPHLWLGFGVGFAWRVR